MAGDDFCPRCGVDLCRCCGVCRACALADIPTKAIEAGAVQRLVNAAEAAVRACDAALEDNADCYVNAHDLRAALAAFGKGEK